jgi:two-component system KDP operon response regulator KdpE
MDAREYCDASARSETASPSGARVLVVDGDRAILRTMDVNLRARGYQVLTAATGRRALALAARKRPDLVILDVELPDLEGLELIAGLRGWTPMPVIVLSARVDEATKVAALDAGANDYITKPFGIAELVSRLRAALRVALPQDQERQARGTRAIRHRWDAGHGLRESWPDP